MARQKVIVDSPLGYIFFMAYIGAVIYFWQQSVGFSGHLWAILQAAVWPAYVMHAVLGLLQI